MKKRTLFFAAGLCSVGIILGMLAGCASAPEPAEEAPAAPEPVREDVWTLLARGEGEKARPFFMGEVDVNATDGQGRTPLHYAAENKDAVLAAFFIAMGARVDALDNEERTPLSVSAGKGDAPTARALAAAGANIHYPMKGDTSPARIAVSGGGEFLNSLLTPVSVKTTDAEGKTILHLAAVEGKADAVNAVLRAGGSFAAKDNNGETALDIALRRTDSRDHAASAAVLILAGAESENPLYGYFAPAVKTSNYNIRSADGMAPLHYIAREGCMGYITFMLENNADVNIKNASGASPLHEAARSGNVMIMEALLDRGAGINTQDAEGNSPLHIAVPSEAALQAANLFLSRGADPNIRDDHGDSPLHVAVLLDRQEDVIRALLEKGADVSIRDIDGKTPLYLAVEKNRINQLPLLLSYGSDIFAADNKGVTPYEKALIENTAMVFPLITDETVLQNDSDGNTLLHLTVRSGGNTVVMNSLLDHYASINARNKAGDTGLTIAVRLDEEPAGVLLLERGADIFAANAAGESPLYLTFPRPGQGSEYLREWMLTPHTLGARDGLGNTALHHIAQWRLDDWIPHIIRMGADTEAANATGETPLFEAVKQDSPSTVRVLTENGAVLGARDTLGNSALHTAVRWNAIHSAETLLDLGLDVNCYALNGKTPLHDSIRWWMIDIGVMLVMRGADIEKRDTEGNTPFMEAVLAGNPWVMDKLADEGVDIHTRNYKGDTALHITAMMDRIDLSTQLLSRGASIHARNAKDRTPFQNAVNTSPRLVRLFLTRGNRLNSSDDYGSSPLHIAVAEKAPVSLVKTILDMGARPNSVDAEGRTPVRLAVDLDLFETANLLADSGADVFVAARDGKTAAEAALTKGETAVRALFSGDAIHSSDATGNTALHYAAQQGNSQMISILLSLGADKDARNIARESPAEIALRWKYSEAAALLNYSN